MSDGPLPLLRPVRTTVAKPTVSATALTPVTLDAAYGQLFGDDLLRGTRLNPYVDDSMIGRTEPDEYMGWEEGRLPLSSGPIGPRRLHAALRA